MPLCPRVLHPARVVQNADAAAVCFSMLHGSPHGTTWNLPNVPASTPMRSDSANWASFWTSGRTGGASAGNKELQCHGTCSMSCFKKAADFFQPPHSWEDVSANNKWLNLLQRSGKPTSLGLRYVYLRSSSLRAVRSMLRWQDHAHVFSKAPFVQVCGSNMLKRDINAQCRFMMVHVDSWRMLQYAAHCTVPLTIARLCSN